MPSLNRGTLAEVALVLLALTGCKVNEGDIEAWKGTIKGPTKMVAVMLSDKYPLALKARAGIALVEMERGDVDGTEELTRAMQRLGPTQRFELIRAMADGLESLMRGGDAAQTEATGGATELQARAKDAVFALADLADPETRTRFVNSVINWYSADFNGRNLAGKTSAEQVIRKLGSQAATRLVDGMNAKIPPAALVKLTQLVSETGDAAAKKRAAERLVAAELEMESKPFVEWLKSKVRDEIKNRMEELKKQSAAATDPRAPAQIAKQLKNLESILRDEKRLNETAEPNRENYVAGALTALKYLAGEEVVIKRLLEIASTQSRTDAMTARRQSALQALEGKVKEKHLDVLLKLALDSNNPVAVRDYAFDRVGDIGSKRAIDSLWPLVANGEDQRLRWRAGELVLSIGGADVLPQFFSRLPGGATKFEPEELDGYATRMSDMTPPPRAIALEKLRSSSWWDRVIAVRYLEKKGTKQDVDAMKALENDNGAVVGKAWKNFEWKTVGDVTKEAVKSAQARLAAGQG